MPQPTTLPVGLAVRLARLLRPELISAKERRDLEKKEIGRQVMRELFLNAYAEGGLVDLGC